MALNISPVHRNLHTRVSFLYLEFEDWFVVIGLAAITNIAGRWVDRHMFGIPMNVFLQYVVPVLSIPFLMLFKYGKPRGYLKDFLAWRRGEKNIPARSAIITLDDGWNSTYETAWPILRKFGYPFTLFVYTD
jgi:hypothetical protein